MKEIQARSISALGSPSRAAKSGDSGNHSRFVAVSENEGSARCLSGSNESAGKIENSIRYMRQHLDKPVQVATLAALVNISPSHYFALFKRETGHAPMDYFAHLRMQEACRILSCTDLSIKETAAALGYEDPFHFSRVFKTVMSVSPTMYRIVRNKKAARGEASSRGKAVSLRTRGWNLGAVMDVMAAGARALPA